MATEPVETLKAFDRSIDNVDSPIIQYPKLEVYADEARHKEKDIWREFWSSDDDSIEEADRAEALARGYLVLTALQLQTEPERERTKTSQRFTEAATELYGQPNMEEARKLMVEEYYKLVKLLDNPAVEQARLSRLLEFFIDQLGEVPTKADNAREDFSEAQTAIRQVFEAKYGEAYKIFDSLDMSRKKVPITEIVRLFEEAKAVLARDEPAWNNEKIVLTDKDKKSASYDDQDHSLKIGQNGSYSPDRVKRLFLEELLVHAQRSINGAQTGSELLEHGLPGYLDSDEGLAKFIQVATGHELTERSTDFYIDFAFALGQFGQPPISRPELVNHHMDLMIVRRQARGEKVNQTKIEDDAWRYANRIYRGSLGNEHVAVNTKDISYYHGYLKMARYIKQQLAEGVEPGKLYDYLISAKFDPTNPSHVEYLARFGITLN